MRIPNRQGELLGGGEVMGLGLLDCRCFIAVAGGSVVYLGGWVVYVVLER
jgi:hypothetical protein